MNLSNYPGENPPDEIKIYELSLIWKEAAYNFAFWETLALDWDKAYKDALPRVLAAHNLGEYYLELMRFLALLRDGHTKVWFPKAVEDYMAKLPIMTKLIGGEIVVSNVKQVAADKVKRWSIIKKIGGIDVWEHIERHIYPYIWHEKPDSVYDWMVDKYLRSGEAGSQTEFVFEDQLETAVLTYTKGDTNWIYNDRLKPSELFTATYQSDSHRIELTKDGIAVITIDTMMNDDLPKDFYANVPLLEKARGYIIDIRNNGGGKSSNGDGVAAAFIGVDCPGLLTGPLIVLSSPNTASAAEDFLVMLDTAKRAVIVGSPSCGSTGQPLSAELESGGGFMICTRHCLYPDGREFVNTGVLPHMPCEMTLEDYQNGVDTVMDRGLAAARESYKQSVCLSG